MSWDVQTDGTASCRRRTRCQGDDCPAARKPALEPYPTKPQIWIGNIWKYGICIFPDPDPPKKVNWRFLQAMRMFLPRVNGVSESKRACEANSWRRLRGLIAETRPLSHFWDLTNIQKYGDSINKQGI